jgi:hypothetical protein
MGLFLAAVPKQELFVLANVLGLGVATYSDAKATKRITLRRNFRQLYQ